MTARHHSRSPSPEDAQPTLLKRLKSSHISDGPEASSSTSGTSGGAQAKFTPLADPTPHFAPDLFGPTHIHRLHTEYDASGPFKHVVVDKLFQDDLLKEVKDEALAELSFSEKETDIYKVCIRSISLFGPYLYTGGMSCTGDWPELLRCSLRAGSLRVPCLCAWVGAPFTFAADPCRVVVFVTSRLRIIQSGPVLFTGPCVAFIPSPSSLPLKLPTITAWRAA